MRIKFGNGVHMRRACMKLEGPIQLVSLARALDHLRTAGVPDTATIEVSGCEVRAYWRLPVPVEDYEWDTKTRSVVSA